MSGLSPLQFFEAKGCHEAAAGCALNASAASAVACCLIQPEGLHASFSKGRKVTLAVICLMMAWISEVISLSDFSGACLHKMTNQWEASTTSKLLLHSHPPFTTALSVKRSKVHLSRTSLVSLLVMTRTIFCSSPRNSQSAVLTMNVVL